MTKSPQFYLTGTHHGLSASEAKKIANENMPAVARPQDRADWGVFFLDTKPRQPGQHPFHVLNGDWLAVTIEGSELRRLRK